MHTAVAGIAAAAGALALIGVERIALVLALVALVLGVITFRRTDKLASDLKTHVLDPQTRELEDWPECGLDED
jgi:hypothetical protein